MRVSRISAGSGVANPAETSSQSHEPPRATLLEPGRDQGRPRQGERRHWRLQTRHVEWRLQRRRLYRRLRRVDRGGGVTGARLGWERSQRFLGGAARTMWTFAVVGLLGLCGAGATFVLRSSASTVGETTVGAPVSVSTPAATPSSGARSEPTSPRGRDSGNEWAAVSIGLRPGSRSPHFASRRSRSTNYAPSFHIQCRRPPIGPTS